MEQDLKRHIHKLSADNERLQGELKELRESLGKMEFFIKETHHRTKNHFMVIASLLKLQSREVNDERVREMFLQSRNRVRSVSLIHDKLSQSNDLTHVRVAEYIRELATRIFHTYQVDTRAIILETDDVQDVYFDIKKLMPCGLILNELITNALKHAFPEIPEGTVQVGLRHEDAAMYTLAVKDTGVGFPKELEPHTATSLGMRMITTLTRQIDGSIELLRDGGTEFRITFKG